MTGDIECRMKVKLPLFSQEGLGSRVGVGKEGVWVDLLDEEKRTSSEGRVPPRTRKGSPSVDQEEGGKGGPSVDREVEGDGEVEDSSVEGVIKDVWNKQRTLQVWEGKGVCKKVQVGSVFLQGGTAYLLTPTDTHVHTDSLPASTDTRRPYTVLEPSPLFCSTGGSTGTPGRDPST